MSQVAIKPFAQLVEEGRVCQPKFFVQAPDFVPGGVAMILGAYLQHCARRKAIIFCVTVEHAEMVAARFVAHGIPAATLLGNQNRAERDANTERYRSGDLMVLTTVNVLDIRLPETDAVIIAAPTNSRARFHQQVSLALAPRFAAGHRTLTSDERRAAIAASDKPHATVIDLAGNVLRLGLDGVQ